MAKNIKDLLMSATAFPAAIEAKLPEGAPKLSTMLADVTGMLPSLPDFPFEIPDLPAPPELPAIPQGPEGLRKVISGVDVTPVQQRREIIPSPAVGVLPGVLTRRGM